MEDLDRKATKRRSVDHDLEERYKPKTSNQHGRSSNTGSNTKSEEIRMSPGTPEINLKCEEKSNIVYTISATKQSKTLKQKRKLKKHNQHNPEDSRLGLTQKRLSEEHDEEKMAKNENSDKKLEVKNCDQEPPPSEPKITGEETIMCQIFDHKEQKFVCLLYTSPSPRD